MLPFPRCLLTPASKTHLHHHLTFHAPVIALTSLDSPLSSSVHVYLPAHALHLYPPRSSIFLSHFKHIYCIYTHTQTHTLKMPTIDKRTQAHAGVSHSSLSAFPYALVLLPFVRLFALLVLCVVDTSWHVAKSPGHLSALLSCPLSATALTTLLCRVALCCQHVTSAGALQQKAGASQPASQLALLR